MKTMMKRLLLIGAAMTLVCGCKGTDSKATGSDTANGTDRTAGTEQTVGSDTGSAGKPDIAFDTNHAPDDVGYMNALAMPPGGADAADVPMFVSIGFDDNGFVDGMEWILDFMKDKKNKDGSPARLSFYVNCGFVDDDDTYNGPANVRVGDGSAPADLVAVWQRAHAEGHEIGNHTVHHRQAFNFWGDYETNWSIDDWRYEVGKCHEILVNQVKIPDADIIGFRTPFLGYNDDLYTVLEEQNYTYDCSMEEGWQLGNGTNFPWPYDLAIGSQVDPTLVGWAADGGNVRAPVGSHPGIWEMPVHPVVIPPDYRCEEYGIAPGVRTRLKSVEDYFDVVDGKMTGLDYNMLDEFPLSGEEIAATLKYTLDLRLKGNRAPMVFGAHTPYYSAENSDVSFASPADLDARRQAIEDFLTYALSKEEVRVVTSADILDWIVTHTPKDTAADTGSDTAAEPGTGVDTAGDTATI